MTISQEQVTDSNQEAPEINGLAVSLPPENAENQESIDPIEKARQEAYEKGKQDVQDAVNKRIAKEVYKRKVIEGQVSDLRGIIDQLQPKEPEKTLSDFNSDEEYISYKVNQALKGTQSKPNQDTPKGDKEIFGDVVDEYTQKEQEYAKNNPDYYQNVNKLGAIFDGLISAKQANQAKLFKEALYHASPEITDYLARNLDDAEYIASLSPIKMGIEIAKLSGTIPQKSSEKKAENSKPRTPPPPTVPRATAGGQKQFNASDLSDHEHFVYLSKKRLGLIK